MLQILALAILFLAGFVNASEDQISLKGGTKLQGKILAENDSQIVFRLKYGTVTLDRADIDKIDRAAPEEKSAPPVVQPVDTNRTALLPAWEKCLDALTKRKIFGLLKQIPATVIDKGILKNVPYMSWRSGNYEFNIYGDPQAPACVEIGVYADLLKSDSAKKECRELLGTLLGSAEDRKMLQSVNMSKDMKMSDWLTIEVTPETAEDAYGGWWISIYNEHLLEKARATDEEMKSITVSKDTSRTDTVKLPAPPTESDLSTWRSDDMKAARSSNPAPTLSTPAIQSTATPSVTSTPSTPTNSSGTVYVRGYYRKDGTYVHSYTRRK